MKGVCCKVSDRSLGRTTDEDELALGSQGHSAKKAASTLDTSNSLNIGASPERAYVNMVMAVYCKTSTHH